MSAETRGRIWMLSTLYFAPHSKSGIFASASMEANHGGLAQLARALAWHARGHRFDSDILHKIKKKWFINANVKSLS